MTHRIEEIKRRLSVLEKRLEITPNNIRGEPAYDEITRRLAKIKSVIHTVEVDDDLSTIQFNTVFENLERYELQLNITGNKNPDAPPTRPVRKPYKSNFKKLEGIGNAIITGDRLTITIPGAEWISGAIYRNNLPYIAGQSHKNDEDNNAETITFLLKKRKITRLGFRVAVITGKYQLKLRYGGKSFSSYYNGYNDEFEILPKGAIPK